MFSERLKALRTKKCLTQNELANELGISNKTVSVYEKGTSLPSIETLENIATYFKVTIDYLVGYSDEPNPKFDKLSTELKISLDAIRAITTLESYESKVLSAFLEDELFHEFIKNVFMYQYLLNTKLNVSIVLDDDFFPSFTQQEKIAIMSQSFRSQAISSIEKILDGLIVKEPPATE